LNFEATGPQETVIKDGSVPPSWAVAAMAAMKGKMMRQIKDIINAALSI
jgi:hypothetical protein